VLICPNGVAILLVGVMMEILYRICIALSLLENGLEFLALGFGVVGFSILFSFKLFIYFVKPKDIHKK
jgi:hypothetical protein